MTSTKHAGRQRELEVEKALMASGLFRTTWRPGNKSHFIGPGRVVSQSQDILHAYDIIAVLNDGRIYLAQVTTIDSGATSSRRQNVMALHINPKYTPQSVWGRQPHKGWRIWNLTPHGWNRHDLPLRAPVTEQILNLNPLQGGR